MHYSHPQHESAWAPMRRLVLGVASLGNWAGAAEAAPLLPHQEAHEIDTAATGCILTSTALVLLMTMPGLALFYGGMVRRKNVLGTAAQAVASCVVVTVLWFALGYSLSFGKAPHDGLNQFIGSLDAAFLNGLRPDTAHAAAPALPEYLWVAYQLTFAVITPALIAGAFAERMRFSAFLLFVAL